MRLLLDTHVLIWYVDQDHLLTPTAHTAIDDPANDILVSVATIWEIAIKVGIRKLTLSGPYRTWMNQALADMGATVLPITVDYADTQANLPPYHGDPFDRLLVAQTFVEGISLVSADPQLDPYGITRLW
jgi:PIN domain nuclease of toxin-antitoxin system